MPKFYLLIFVILITLPAAVRVVLYKEPVLPKNQPIKFEASIGREPRIYDTYQVIYLADSRVYVDLYPRYRVGDRVLVEGEFDEDGRMFKGKVIKIGEFASLSAARSKFREKISQNISELLPAREATLLTGTVLGVDTISRQFRDELIKTGTIHVVVVSGQNLSIVAGIFLALARYVGRRKSMILAIFAVFAYAFLTGFEPPVIRASIMVLVSALAVFLGREADVLWSLVLAAIIIILVWPQALFEISFQLTFAATLGIVTVGKWLSRQAGSVKDAGPVARHPHPTSSLQSNLKIVENNFSAAAGARWGSPTRVTRVFNIFTQIAAVPISAYIFTAPVIFYYFKTVSPIAPLANVLVGEAVFPIMILGFLVSGASLIFMPLAQVLAYLAFVPAFYFSQVVGILAKIV